MLKVAKRGHQGHDLKWRATIATHRGSFSHGDY